MAYARSVPERFFCWAPFDIHTRYHIEVRVGGAVLSREEVEERYRYAAGGWEPRSIHNVFSIIRQYESTYAEAESARVNVRYAVNGHPEEVWRWPE